MPRSIERIRSLTGAEPYVTDPEPGQWYWSGALALGPDCFLEILGPNPEHDGFHPIKELILGYREPRLLFWYIATDDFDAFRGRLEASGAPMERIETVDFEREGSRSHYKRGIIGPGFETQRPCVIEWRERTTREEVDQRCRLEALRLHHPDAAKINRVFQNIGIKQTVEEGDSWIALDIATPKGRVTFENPGESFAGASAMLRTARLYLRHLLRAMAAAGSKG